MCGHSESMMCFIAEEMRNRRNFYVQVNPQQHPACSESKGEITESSNFFSLDDLINLSLEYVNSINDKNLFSVVRLQKINSSLILSILLYILCKDGKCEKSKFQPLRFLKEYYCMSVVCTVY